MSFTRKAGAWPRAGSTARRPGIKNERTNRRAGLVLMERLSFGNGRLSATRTCDFRGKISSWQRQMERRSQEDRHLAAGDRLIGAVVAAAAAGGDAVRRELLDPARGVVGRRHVGEAGGG